jgi:hypothetical protein
MRLIIAAIFVAFPLYAHADCNNNCLREDIPSPPLVHGQPMRLAQTGACSYSQCYSNCMKSGSNNPRMCSNGCARRCYQN